MSYKSQAQQAIEDSPLSALRKWRNVPESTVEALDDFVYWLETDDNAPELPSEDLNSLKSLIDEYVMDAKIKKVQQGERELLVQWIKACGGSGLKINKQGHRFINAVHDFEHCGACKD